MTFIAVKNNARSRFTEVQVYLSYLSSIEPANPVIPTSLELRIMKGLFYVHLYAALEKTVNEVIENTLLYVGSNNVTHLHLNNSFSPISLIDRLQAFKDCGHKNFLDKAMEIFSTMESSSVATINQSAFSNKLENIWMKTVDEVLKAFGISITVAPRIRTTINELVDKRNAVAHGRESASRVGSSFRTNELRTRMNNVSDFAMDFVDAFENFYLSKGFLKAYAKKKYTLIT